METEKKEIVPLGRLVFLGGVILAVVSGFFEIKPLPMILAFLGLFVGVLNVRDQETSDFLIAIVALSVVGMAALQAISLPELILEDLGTANVIETITTVLRNFTAFVSSAGFIVAFRQVYNAAKPKP